MLKSGEQSQHEEIENMIMLIGIENYFKIKSM